MHLSMQMTTQDQSTWLLDSGIARISEVEGGETLRHFLANSLDEQKQVVVSNASKSSFWCVLNWTRLNTTTPNSPNYSPVLDESQPAPIRMGGARSPVAMLMLHDS